MTSGSLVTAPFALVLSVAMAGPQSPPVSVSRDLNTGRVVLRQQAGSTLSELVFEPATGVIPRIALDGVSPRGLDGEYTYTYTFANGAQASQMLNKVSFETVRPTRFMETPSGWQPNELPAKGTARGRIYWYRRIEGEALLGVEPGGVRGGFQVASPHLPGVLFARCKGNTHPPLVTDGIPAGILEELDKLMQEDYVEVPFIGPAIPAGENEPEMSFDVLIRRIWMNYATHLQRARFPDATRLLTDIQGAARAAEAGDAGGAADVIGGILRSLNKRYDNPWHQELAKGLRRALNLASGKFW